MLHVVEPNRSYDPETVAVSFLWPCFRRGHFFSAYVLATTSLHSTPAGPQGAGDRTAGPY
jgi:hypothetical protein